MARTRIEINVPEERMASNKARMAAADKFAYIDRTPVLFGFCPRAQLAARGVGWLEYFSDAKTQMYHQIMNQKWMYENLPDDRCVEPVIRCIPDWENAAAASGLGCEIAYTDDSPPRAIPFMETPEDVEKYQVRDHTSGLWGTRCQWYEEMLEYRSEFQIIFNGQEIPIDVFLHAGGESPFTSAIDMAEENLLIWMIEEPEISDMLLEKITQAMIEAETHFRTLTGHPLRGGYFTTDDPVGMLSAKTYKERVVPFTKRLFDHFAPKGTMRLMHLCGKLDHVLDIFIDDLEITILQGAGYVNPMEIYLPKANGRVQIQGNFDPQLLLNGPIDTIKSHTEKLIRTLGPKGGLVLQEGYNICPGTPVEHMAAVVEVAEEMGVPDGARLA